MSALVESIDKNRAVDGRSVSVRSLLKRTGLEAYICTDEFNEVSVNKPGTIWTKKNSTWKKHDAPGCDLASLKQLANALAIYNGTQISAEKPLLSVVLPDGQRGQLTMPPACEMDTLYLTIRVPSSKRFSVDDYINTGRLSKFKDVSEHLQVPEDVALQPWELACMDAKARGDMRRFLELAVENHLNFVFVGGTGSGKTTFSKSVADMIPLDERLATIEDTHELDLPNHPNRGHFFYGRFATPKEVIRGLMRWNPDRIFLTELRGDEAWDYLSMLNTGHPGSITSVHANDCRSAYYRVGALIKQSEIGQTMDFGYIMREVMTTLDVVMFFQNTELKELFYDPVRKWKLQRGQQ